VSLHYGLLQGRAACVTINATESTPRIINAEDNQRSAALKAMHFETEYDLGHNLEAIYEHIVLTLLTS
jgi:hypothetical protein